MAEMSFWNLQLPASVMLGVVAGAAYLIAYARHRRSAFTLVDALILVSVMAIVTAVAMPLLGTASDRANSAALSENLRLLQVKIEIYKVEHGGKPPLLFKGTFPQLTHATNSKGEPGPSGKPYPFGP